MLGQVSVLSGGGPSNRYPAGTRVTFERVSGHRDGDRTTCPGDALFAQLPQIRAAPASSLPSSAAGPAGRAHARRRPPDARVPQAAQLSGRAPGADGAPLAGAPVSIQIASSAGFVTLGAS